jgi:hypothetical protein
MDASTTKHQIARVVTRLPHGGLSTKSAMMFVRPVPTTVGW